MATKTWKCVECGGICKLKCDYKPYRCPKSAGVGMAIQANWKQVTRGWKNGRKNNGLD